MYDHFTMPPPPHIFCFFCLLNGAVVGAFRFESPRRLPRRQCRLEAQLYVGIDCGTQGTKAVVYDAERREVVGVGSASHDLIVDSSRPGMMEQDPLVWEEAMEVACREALNGVTRSEVRGLGVGGQQHGLVALDSDYSPLRPAKLWCDTESSAEAEHLSSELGWSVVAAFTSSKLLWMKNNEPDLFAKLAHVALPHDYLNFKLTGSLSMEAGDASGTGLLDVDEKTWDAKAVELVDRGLFDKLPPKLTEPTEAAGYLLPGAATKLGLEQGIPVSCGSGDNMMSALGCGATKAGRVAISLGTSGTLFARTSRAVRDPSGLICPFLDATGGGLPLLCTLNCASVPEEVRLGYGLTRSDIEEAALKEPVGCEDLSFLPYLIGERSPNWPWATGAAAGIRPGHLSRPGLLYRAALEGATYSLKAGVASLEKEIVALSGPPTSEIRLVGGGAKSSLWRQIVADALQLPVAVPSVTESAALGAALQAAALVEGATDVAAWIDENHDAPIAHVVAPDPDTAAAYEDSYERHRHLGSLLFERK